MTSSRIFVQGIPPNFTSAELRKHFSAGNREVTDVKVFPGRRFGYVGFKTADEASKAIKYFNKTYIRMSKISVESAKPVSDPALNNSRGGLRAHVPSIKRKAPEKVTDDAHEDGAKKRRREDGAPVDPKLKEFLQVMGRGQESILDTVAGHSESAPDETTLQIPVPEAESDDEYEVIPSLKKNQSNGVSRKGGEVPGSVLASTLDEGVVSEGRDAAKESKDSSRGPIAEDGEKTVEGTSGQFTAVNDDDWLRSRTNRLLDLVDPDDLPVGQKSDSTSPVSKDPGIADDTPKGANSAHDATGAVTRDEPAAETSITPDTRDIIRRTSRLFLRNLPYAVTEDEIREEFEKFGDIEEVHLPTSKSGSKKGFALVLFAEPSQALEAFEAMDGATFQGRLLHIIPADVKRETGLDEFALSKLPLKKQNMIRKKAEAASNTFNWNSLYMNQDAVNASVANRLGVSKSELLDPTSSDAAVKQAIAETSVIQETKAYFVANGVDLDAFKSHKRGDKAILVKNFPYGTSLEELRTLFEEAGPVLRVLMPPSGTIAIVEFSQPNHAKTAFGKLAYRRVKDSVLFLEKAPKDLFREEAHNTVAATVPPADRPTTTGIQKLNVNDLLAAAVNNASEDVGAAMETTSLFVRNLNFETTTTRLAEVCSAIDGFVSARVKTKADPKKPGQTLSMGFGFVEFLSKAQAQEGLKTLDGYVLDGHTLAVKPSHRGLDAAEERRRDDQARRAANKRTKIIIKNLPFQATKKDVRALFGTYGQLRSVRVPKKADYSTRGFAFADFVTPREAENALNALKDTHLLGRKLVLDYAEAEAVDAEEEIERMQRKVGGQVNKMALQQLTGRGRQKVNIGDSGGDPEG